jgi:hypothetical protein
MASGRELPKGVLVSVEKYLNRLELGCWFGVVYCGFMLWFTKG